MPRKFKLDRAWRSEKANNIVGLLPSEKNVLHRLVYRGGDRGFCFASYQRLATDTGLDRRTVQRTFQSLKRKMLIRTKQLKRPNGTLGPNACAITLAVEDRVYGHGVPNQGDTESGLKIKSKNKTKSETYADRYCLLEHELFDILGGLIEWPKNKELLSLHEVTKWLQSQNGLQWDQEKATSLLSAARTLRNKLVQNSEKITSWTTLIRETELLRAPARKLTLATASALPNDNEWIQRILAASGFDGDQLLKLQRYLSEFSCREEGESIILEANSRHAVDEAYGLCRKALNALTTETEKVFEFVCKGSVVYSSAPK